MQCPDEELAQRWKDGDISAFEALFRRYERRVLNVAARMIGSVDDAEDLTQETFIRAHKRIRGYRGGRFCTWLFRIAANLCVDYARRRRPATCSLEDLVEQADWQQSDGGAGDPEDALIRKEFSESVWATLASIPPHYRVLLVLRHIDGMSYEEIARVIGCTRGALGVRLHRAREVFRQRMRPLLEGGGGSASDEMQRGKAKDIPAL